MLRPFYNLPLDLQEVGPLKGFEAKVIIVKISIIDYLTVQTSSILQQESQLSMSFNFMQTLFRDNFEKKIYKKKTKSQEFSVI